MCLQGDEERQISAYTPRSPSAHPSQVVTYEPPECGHDLGKCVVCLMNNVAPRIPIGCGHCVCRNPCLVRIFITSAHCPLCRIPMERIQTIYFQ